MSDEGVAPSLEEAPDYEQLYQRTLADSENLRRRVEEEKKQFAKYAQGALVEDLLPVVDNFYRATEHVPDEQRKSAWLTGILHIQKQLLDVLMAAGISEIAVKKGDAFNSQLHEAIGTAVSTEVPEDHIIEVKNRGYMLHDRMLRPAQVIVSSTKDN